VTVLFPVLSGVAVLGSVTAADQPAAETGPEMDPPVAELDALHAHVSARFYGDQVVEMLTLHGQLSA
jgi:hypothetical protein